MYMRFSDLNVLRHLGSGIIGFTVFLMMLFGLWFWSNAASVPANVNIQLPAHSQVREIASIQDIKIQPNSPGSILNEAVGSDVPKQDPKFATISVNCQSGIGQTLQSVARLVRIKIRPCRGTITQLDGSRVVNLANGNEGTLFKLEDGEITTDYIHLVNGQNQVKIRLVGANGRTYASDVTIVRSNYHSADNSSTSGS